MVVVERHQLQKEVEVDETLVGGFMSGKYGRDHEGKTLVVIAAEVDGRKIGRIRMKRITNASAVTLHNFVKSEISPGAIVHTDGWRGYFGIDNLGYVHKKTIASSVGEEELMPKVHLVASLLKRWLLGTFQGRPASKYLDHYLDEYVFRFNRRKSNARGLLFYRVLENAVITSPSTSADIKLNQLS
jgi:transposase-like protein